MIVEEKTRAQDCALRGLTWLKESGPMLGMDVDLINLETMNISWADRCVLAQVHIGRSYGAAFNTVTQYLGNGDYSYADVHAWMIEHGFAATAGTPVEMVDAWQMLQNAWVELLNQETGEEVAA